MFDNKGFINVKSINNIPVDVDPVPETTEEYKKTRLMKPLYIVIHNTANKKPTATDTANNNFMKQDDDVLWHFTVDDDSITQGHSIYRSGLHAGDGLLGKGNAKGIGIEIAENGDTAKAISNAFYLIMYLEDFIPDLIIKPHQFFSGKYCPRWILDTWGWDGFMERYNSFKKSFNTNSPAGDHWGLKHFNSLNKKGIVIHEQRFDDLMTRAEIFALLDRVVK